LKQASGARERIPEHHLLTQERDKF